MSELVKKSVCMKVSVQHMGKDFYSPCCVLRCKDIYGSRHNMRADKYTPILHTVKYHCSIIQPSPNILVNYLLLGSMWPRSSPSLPPSLSKLLRDQDLSLVYTTFEVIYLRFMLQSIFKLYCLMKLDEMII